MTPVLFKMADINVGHLKVKMDFLKRWHPKYTRKRTQHAFVDRIDNSALRSLFGITRQSLVMPRNDPRDRIFYPIYKLMIDSNNLRLCRLEKEIFM